MPKYLICHYPWVVLVKRHNKIIPRWHEDCGGSIITQTVAVTASHCICGIPETLKSLIPDDKKLLVECQGGVDIDFQLLPPNEVTNSNMLSAIIGNKDKTQGRKVNIFISYVMGSRKKNPNLHRFEDIGIILTKDLKGNGESFYQHSKPSKNINVGSICLAAEKKNSPYMNEGKVVTVGWGDRYSDVKSGEKPEQKKHSCSTNEFGPILGRLRQCDVDDITLDENDWGCDRYDMPAGYDETKCDDYLEKAERAIVKEIGELDESDTLSTLWSLTNKIEVISADERHVCYKQNLFIDYGWCYVYDA